MNVTHGDNELLTTCSSSELSQGETIIKVSHYRIKSGCLKRISAVIATTTWLVQKQKLGHFSTISYLILDGTN